MIVHSHLCFQAHLGIAFDFYYMSSNECKGFVGHYKNQESTRSQQLFHLCHQKYTLAAQEFEYLKSLSDLVILLLKNLVA